jgi:hypothetical protein
MHENKMMTDYETEQFVSAIYALAAEQLRDGNEPEKVEQLLVEQGLEPESAAMVVQNLREARKDSQKEQGQKNMVYGALWFTGGLLVTLISYAAAAGGGKYLLAYGAVIGGAIQFIAGLAMVKKSESGTW